MSSIVHCPGCMRWPIVKNLKWERYVWRFFHNSKIAGSCTDSDDITFITYNNHGRPGLLERSAEHLGLSTPVVLGQDITTKWRWIYKITLVRDYLLSGECTTPYVACIDSDDAMIIGDPHEAVENFKRMGAEMLFCRGGNWPPSACAVFEAATYLFSDVPKDLRFLNANFMGRTDYVLERLNDLLPMTVAPDPGYWFATKGHSSSIRHNREGYDFNDQLAWRTIHMHCYPEILIDVEQTVLAEFKNRKH